MPWPGCSSLGAPARASPVVSVCVCVCVCVHKCICRGVCTQGCVSARVQVPAPRCLAGRPSLRHTLLTANPGLSWQIDCLGVGAGGLWPELEDPSGPSLISLRSCSQHKTPTPRPGHCCPPSALSLEASVPGRGSAHRAQACFCQPQMMGQHHGCGDVGRCPHISETICISFLELL